MDASNDNYKFISVCVSVLNTILKKRGTPFRVKTIIIERLQK